jgi:hypothetical protein
VVNAEEITNVLRNHINVNVVSKRSSIKIVIINRT